MRLYSLQCTFYSDTKLIHLNGENNKRYLPLIHTYVNILTSISKA